MPVNALRSTSHTSGNRLKSGRPDRTASLFRSAERTYGEVDAADVRCLTGLSRLKTNKVLRALGGTSTSPEKARRYEGWFRVLVIAQKRAYSLIWNRQHPPS